MKRKSDFSKRVRKEIKDRDGGCIFCRLYGNSGFPATQIAHYMPRSQLGAGIPENGAYVCAPHHQQLDNSAMREEMLEAFKRHLKGCHPDWDEKRLAHDKWKWANGLEG